MFSQFPPGFNSGDDVGMDMKLPNAVFNTLKQHSQTAERKTHRVHEKKEHSTAVSLAMSIPSLQRTEGANQALMLISL